jgi:hypothetical protein
MISPSDPVSGVVPHIKLPRVGLAEWAPGPKGLSFLWRELQGRATQKLLKDFHNNSELKAPFPTSAF